MANSKELQACTPASIVTSSLRAVTMGLHLDLDEAYLVPFKDQCTLVTGYKGMRNMAIRTNKYRILHAGPIKAGWTVQFHPITGQAEHVQEAGAPAGVVAHLPKTFHPYIHPLPLRAGCHHLTQSRYSTQDKEILSTLYSDIHRITQQVHSLFATDPSRALA